MQIRLWTALVTTIFLAAGALGQTTWYVDDDAPNDPGPGDPTVSDPLEDGSDDHPFDAIQEGIDAAVDGDEVVILDGIYTGTGNRNLNFGGRAITVRSDSSDPATCIIDCEFDGRGFVFNFADGPDSLLEGLTIRNGRAGYKSPGGKHGGGIHCTSGSSPTLANCMISGNAAPGTYSYGGGVYCEESNPTLTHCTISGNMASDVGGGFYCFRSDTTLTNCILWGNVPQEIHCCWVVASYSDIQGGWTGTGNIDADPLFVGPANDDYHLAAGSPCIDAGDPAFAPASGETDMDGEYRLWDGDDDVARVDMGADEFGSFQFGDLNCDGIVNGFDIDAFIAALKGPAYYDPVYPDCDLVLADINADGVVNGFDIDPYIALLIGE